MVPSPHTTGLVSHICGGRWDVEMAPWALSQREVACPLCGRTPELGGPLHPDVACRVPGHTFLPRMNHL